MPTVALSVERGVAAPRVAFVPFPYNFPMGEPRERKKHRQVVLAALELLYELHEPGEVALPLRWRR